MPTAPTNDRAGRRETSGATPPFVLNRVRRIAATILLSAALSCAASEHCAAAKRLPEDASKNRRPPREKIGYAVWYVVPANSLARRRAGKNEYTAAQNHLPLGAMVRVTYLANGKSVIVRITDRGITDKRDRIDLCKEAAAQLGMLSEGKARVRIEELSDDKRIGANPAPDSSASAAHP